MNYSKYSLTFSALNERLRPRIPINDKLYYSVNRMEDRQYGSLRTLPSYYRPTVLPTKPEPKVSETTTEPEDLGEPKEDAAQKELVCDDLEQGHCAESLPCNSTCLTELNLNEEVSEELVEEDSCISLSEEKDIRGELTSEGRGAPSQSAAGDGGSSLERSYIDGTLPDLIRSGRPLGRRRTLGHVSDTVGLKRLSGCVELERACW